MPELPEVETMVRGLQPALLGRTLAGATAHDPKMLQGATPDEIQARTAGATVQAIGRRGKWVAIALGEDRGIIVIQPRMTGGFWLIAPPRPDHIRLTFHLSSPDGTIWFADARRLGKITWFPDAHAAEVAFARSHGPDALQIGRDDLAARLARTSRGIKPTLMDQKVLAGIGNIYADEVCFRSGLHPERPALGLRPGEVDRLHAAIGSVLAEAIAAEGSTFDGGYRTVLGLEGGFLAINAMYGRGGQPCPSCGGPIRKVKIAGLIGRPTHYCPACQPADTPSESRRGPAA